MGNLLVAVLTTPMNLRPIFLSSKAAVTDAKYESAQTIRFQLAQGETSQRRTWAPCGRWSWWSSPWLEACSSAVLTSFNQIITPDTPQAMFRISKPFSGFLSIAMYIGSPMLIQWPPCPYHLAIDSSTQMRSEGMKYLSRWSLNLVTWSSTNLHLYFSQE
jgi:hypothetical protein